MTRPSAAPPSQISKEPSKASNTGLLATRRQNKAFTQVDRLESLRTEMLRYGKGLTLDEIAVKLGVSTRTARRYLQRLHDTEFELERVQSSFSNVKWRIKASERPRKIGLRRAQVFALLSARHLFEPLKGSALFEEIQLAMDELVTIANRPGRGPNASMIDTAVENRFLYLPSMPADYRQCSDAVGVFYDAVVGLHPVCCTHCNADSTRNPVTLHPYGLVIYQDALVVVAATAASNCTPTNTSGTTESAPLATEPHTIQTYPLHELNDAKLIENTTFSIPPKFDLKHVYHGPFGLHPSVQPTRVIIDFDTAAANTIKNRFIHPSQKISRLREGAIRLILQTDINESLIQWVHSFGPHARVVQPGSLRSRLIDELQQTLRLYRQN